MQFNAIMAAIHCAVLSMNFGKLKFVSAVSLLLHVLASLTLCWAARPIESSPHDKSSEVLSHYHSARDTFRNYRRGWILTMLAVLASVATAGVIAYPEVSKAIRRF